MGERFCRNEASDVRFSEYADMSEINWEGVM
jgi:hypothetical protein